MRSIRKRFGCVLAALTMVFTGITASSVSAASAGKQITIIPNTDEQPFIRQFLPKYLFGSGGPFTVHVQMKAENFKRTNVNGKVYVNIWDGRVESESVVKLSAYTKSTDWVDVKMTSVCEEYNAGMKSGDPITFDNVKGIWLNGALQDYYLLDMGMLWATGTVTFRNFEVKNAAGEVVYSWAEDEDLQGVKDLTEIENPEPMIVRASFGDWSGQFLVSDADTATPTLPTTVPPAYEEPTSPPDTPDATTAPPKSTPPDGPTTAPASEDPSSGTDPASDAATTSPLQGDGSSAGDADSSSAAVAGNPESDGDAGEKSSFSIWIPIGIVAGVLVAAGVVLLVLWKLKKLPWIKE